MDSSLWAVLFLVAALALLFAEVFIPSGGLILLAALICFGSSLWCAWTAWWPSRPIVWWGFLLTSVLLVPVVLSTAVRIWPLTPMGQKLAPPTLAEVTPYQEEVRQLEALLGEVGETLTPLTPGGIVRVAGQRIHCFSEGSLVLGSTPIRVVFVKGLRVVVRPLSPEEVASREQVAPPTPEDDGLPPLDFDMAAR